MIPPSAAAVTVALLAALCASPVSGFFNIVTPVSLTRTFRVSWGPFGPAPAMADPIRGVLTTLGAGSDGCAPAESVPGTVHTADTARRLQPIGAPVLGAIVLVPRGGCTFAEKGRALQRAVTEDGYPVLAVVVYNTSPVDDETVFITDDGGGPRNRIPTLHVTYAETTALREHLQTKPLEPVVVALGAAL